MSTKLERLMKREGKSKSWTAREVGVSPQALGRYASGEVVPPLEVAIKIASVFGKSLDYVIDTPIIDAVGLSKDEWIAFLYRELETAGDLQEKRKALDEAQARFEAAKLHLEKSIQWVESAQDQVSDFEEDLQGYHSVTMRDYILGGEKEDGGLQR